MLELLQVLLSFGLLVELLQGLSVPSEHNSLQGLETMGLVRAETYQFSLDLHRRRPQLDIKFVLH